MQRREFLQTSALASALALLASCRREEVVLLEQTVLRKPYLPGESVYRASVCAECASGCGVSVRTVDENVKKIEGLREHPLNRGATCARGQALPQRLYDPDRVRTPLRRSGARGSGTFEPVSWDVALAAIAPALLDASAGGIVVAGSQPRSLLGALLRRFAAARDAAPAIFLTTPDAAVERQAAARVFGFADRPVYDLARSDFVLSIGAPLLDAGPDPVAQTRGVAALRRGRPGRRGTLVQVEPRMSLTAAAADVWLPVVPGTEGALAMALGSRLVELGAGTPASRRQYRELVASEPIAVEAICDVPAARVERLARALVRAERPLVVCGGTAAAARNGLDNVVAGMALDVLLGALGRPGGVFAPVDFGLQRRVDAGAASGTLEDLVQRLQHGPPVDVLLAVDADPLHTLPGGPAAAVTGDHAPRTIVACASALDDTAHHADWVLPIHTSLERLEVVEPAGVPQTRILGLARGVVEPLYDDTRHPGDVVLALAAASGDALPWSSFTNLVETVMQEALPDLPGGADADFWPWFEEALARGVVSRRAPADRASVPPGPGLGPPAQARAPRWDGDATDYPLVLLPFETVKGADGRAANLAWMQELPDPHSTVMWNAWVEIAPRDARELGIATGDHVRVRSPHGSIELHAVVLPAVRPGVVSVPLGHGHAAYGRYARGRGANVRALLGGSTRVATRVALERVGRGRLALFGAGLRQPESIPRGKPHPKES